MGCAARHLAGGRLGGRDHRCHLGIAADGAGLLGALQCLAPSPTRSGARGSPANTGVTVSDRGGAAGEKPGILSEHSALAGCLPSSSRAALREIGRSHRLSVEFERSRQHGVRRAGRYTDERTPGPRGRPAGEHHLLACRTCCPAPANSRLAANEMPSSSMPPTVRGWSDGWHTTWDRSRSTWSGAPLPRPPTARSSLTCWPPKWRRRRRASSSSRRAVAATRPGDIAVGCDPPARRISTYHASLS